MLNQFMTFLQMGGYAAYVWSAYGIVALVLVWNLIAALRLERRAQNEGTHEL